jgi:predicted translin family RNA/ssDNA-binding protein
MDDYSKEIGDLQREVDRLVEAEGDPQEIAELEMQIRVLKALYEQATTLYEQGRDDPDLRRQLLIRGYGEWTLDNVYAFVFEAAVDLPDIEPKAFVNGISHTDFASLLIAS